MRLTMEAVTIAYPHGPAVLEGVDLRLGRGLWLLVGTNGSGKTSLLRCAAGLLRPSRGIVAWDGKDIWAEPLALRRHLGYAPQEIDQLPDVPASEYLTYLAVLKGIKPAWRDRRVRELLSLLDLEDACPHLCSEGMRRRLAIAAALLNDPELLILDEPTVSLDPQELVRLRALLGDLAADRVILLATHVPEVLAGVADGWILAADKGATCHADRDPWPHQALFGRSDRPERD